MELAKREGAAVFIAAVCYEVRNCTKYTMPYRPLLQSFSIKGGRSSPEGNAKQSPNQCQTAAYRHSRGIHSNLTGIMPLDRCQLKGNRLPALTLTSLSSGDLLEVFTASPSPDVSSSESEDDPPTGSALLGFDTPSSAAPAAASAGAVLA